MRFEAIDCAILPVADAPWGIFPFERLGLRSIPSPGFDGGIRSRCVFFGEDRHLFHLEVAGNDSKHPLEKQIRRAMEEGRGLCGVVLRVGDVQPIVDEMSSRGIECDVRQSAVGIWATLAVEDEAGVPLSLCQRFTSLDDQIAEVAMDDALNHVFPVRRLDHLAAVARNLDAQTHFWTHVLGVPLFGEVVTPKMIIRQFKIGDAIIELLGPASVDSPIHQRAPGLISMMSLEVEDLKVAVASARSAGFTIPDPATGVLPRTITASIPAGEMCGLVLQLLQYE